jgi:hypothetical protein
MIKQIVSKLAVLAALVLLCCSTIFISYSARAQCPTCPCPPVPIDDAQYDTTPIPWQGPYDTCVNISVDDAGDSCFVTICYAARQTSVNNFDYCLLKVCWDPTVCSPDDSLLLDSASWWLMQYNPQHFTADLCPCTGDCSTCHGRDIHWSENFVTCWTICFTQQGGKYLQYCPDHGWCINAYWACQPIVGGPIKLCYDRSVQTTWQCNNQPPHLPCEAPCTKEGCPTGRP